MLTNFLLYSYGIKVDIVRKKNEYYYFFNNNYLYLFKRTNLKEDEILNIYNKIDVNSLFHQIIMNKFNKIISIYNNESYILMNVKLSINRRVVLKDVFDTRKYTYFYVNKIDFLWPKLWEKKISQFEYYISDIDISNCCVSTIINYYLERGYKAINYFNNNVKSSILAINLCHRRLYKEVDLYDYYSPIDLIFDNYIRDVVELINLDIYSQEFLDLKKYLFLLEIMEKDLLISRLLFPSFFFDIIDKVISDKKSLDSIIDYFENFEFFEEKFIKVMNFLENKKEF